MKFQEALQKELENEPRQWSEQKKGFEEGAKWAIDWFKKELRNNQFGRVALSFKELEEALEGSERDRPAISGLVGGTGYMEIVEIIK